jgi:hypothetical protein
LKKVIRERWPETFGRAHAPIDTGSEQINRLSQGRLRTPCATRGGPLRASPELGHRTGARAVSGFSAPVSDDSRGSCGASMAGIRDVRAAMIRRFSRSRSLACASCSRSAAMVSSLAVSRASWDASWYVSCAVSWAVSGAESTQTNTRPSDVFSCFKVPRCMRLRIASS